MHRLTNKEDLEAAVGAPRQFVLMKQIPSLDQECCGMLARSPIAGFGFRDQEGAPHTTFLGGLPGFMRVESSRRVSFDIAGEHIMPAPGDGVSLAFLLPGVGETLRVNGSVSARSEERIVISVDEVFVHCARAILRSGLWKAEAVARSTVAWQAPQSNSDAGAPLQRGEVAGFLASSPFLVVSSWDRNGSSDTSPRGDAPGFLQVLDGRTLAIPDRKGNRRTDTFHNLLTCDVISCAALMPGRDEVLHIRGTAYTTDDATLLGTMAVGGKPPQAALIVCVDQACIAESCAVRASRMWERGTHEQASSAPDLMVAATQHLAHSQQRGVRAAMVRWLSRLLTASPTLIRRLIDLGYRRELREEGYKDS